MRRRNHLIDTKWKLIATAMLAIPSGLIIWSLYLLERIIVPGSSVLLAAILGGIPGIAIFFYIWRKDPHPIWVGIFYGFLIGCSITLFIFIGGNFFFKTDSRSEIYTWILDTGKDRSRRSSCTSVYASVVVNEIEHKVHFPCQMEQTIRDYRQVRLELSEGLFGYAVVENQELIR